MLDKVLDIIPVEIISLLVSFFILMLIVYFCWFLLAFFQGLIPFSVWQWLLRSGNNEDIKYEVKEYREGKVCRPLYIGLISGMLLLTIILVNIRMKENISVVLMLDIGLFGGIILAIFYLKKHGEGMDSHR